MSEDRNKGGKSTVSQKFGEPDYDPLDQPPVEVFAAVDGDRQVLADYLRSGRPLSYYTIDAIAAWMAGELPPKRGRGRHYGTYSDRVREMARMALAASVYRWKYEEAGRPQGKADEYAEMVAKKWQIDLEKFLNYLRRSNKQKHKQPKKPPPLEEMYWEWKEFNQSRKPTATDKNQR